MKPKSISIGDVQIPLDQYASQGNAILGIRDSGKSYTATMIAEQLFESGVPFVAFDPIGIWKYLRVAGKGPGYPIVVAGGRHGDLPLSPSSSPEIVRAAMRENVSLVLDLYSIQMSKADWKAIVEKCVRLLLYENGDYGLRHIFIEEAAEFCPQRVGPDQGKVYAEIEKLARMGGNALLGYTLINQRAEEVNKAVLELCDCLFLHRQKGRNSLTALGKWLDIAEADESKGIIKSLPTLPQGECWVWPSGSDVPTRVHVQEKKTFHPNRRAMHSKAVDTVHKTVDVSTFVKQMSTTLEKVVEEQKQNDPAALRTENAKLKRELERLKSAAPAPTRVIETVSVPKIPKSVSDKVVDLQNRLQVAARNAADLVAEIASVSDKYERGKDWEKKVPAVIPVRPNGKSPHVDSTVTVGITAPQQRIVDALAWLESIGIDAANKKQLALLADQSPSSSGYTNNLGVLRTNGLLTYPGPNVASLTPAGRDQARWPEVPPTTAALQQSILVKLPRPKSAILKALIDAYPDPVTKTELAERAGQSASSSGYTNNLGSLRSLGLIDYPAPNYAGASAILFLD